MSDYQILSDSELTGLLKASDHAAYTEIYRRYYELVFVHTYKKLRDEIEAQDLVQELFIRIWEKRGSIPPVYNLAGYLIKSARNKVLDFMAHQEVESKYIKSLANYMSSYSSIRSDYALREKEFQVYIEKAIEALPAKMRAIFELSRREHLTHKEIADKLDTSEHNVAKQITNAIKVLKTKLGNFFLLLFV